MMYGGGGGNGWGNNGNGWGNNGNGWGNNVATGFGEETQQYTNNNFANGVCGLGNENAGAAAASTSSWGNNNGFGFNNNNNDAMGMDNNNGFGDGGINDGFYDNNNPVDVADLAGIHHDNPSGNDSSRSSNLVFHPSNQICFQGPFNQRVDSKIRLDNPQMKIRVAFKVKSTAPKGKIIVRPNAGVVEPNQSVTVTIVITPHPDISPAIRLPYRVMIQSTIIPNDYYGNISEKSLWSNGNNNIIETKLNCIFYNEMGVPITIRDLPPLPKSHRKSCLEGSSRCKSKSQKCCKRDNDEGLFVTLTHLYVGLVILIIGFITGKWIY